MTGDGLVTKLRERKNTRRGTNRVAKYDMSNQMRSVDGHRTGKAVPRAGGLGSDGAPAPAGVVGQPLLVKRLMIADVAASASAQLSRHHLHGFGFSSLGSPSSVVMCFRMVMSQPPRHRLTV
jgi:hypothetical protein